MGDKVSAVPDDLMGYANAANPNDQNLVSLAHTASAAIQAFLKSGPDSSVMSPISDVGAAAAAYAAQKGVVDQWVFDVGLAFLSVADQQLPPSTDPDTAFGLGMTMVSIGSSQLESALTNNPLTQLAKKDAGELNSLLTPGEADPLQERAQFEALIQKILLEDNDPIQLAALFKELGVRNTLLTAHYLQIMDPNLLSQFSGLLATATNSPTWDDSFDKSLAGDGIGGNLTTLEGQPLDPSALMGLLQNGVFSASFLANVGDVLMPGPNVDPLHAGLVIPAFFNALARNPEAAFAYLTGKAPDQSGSRLSMLEQMKQIEMSLGQPPDSWMSSLGLATLAANTWVQDGGAPAGSDLTLLKDLAAEDWQDVPDSFRGAILQIVSQHLGRFLDDGGPDYLTAAEQQDLITLAVTDNGGSVNSKNAAALQDAIADYVRKDLPVPDPNNQTATLQWIDVVTKLASLPALGATVGKNSEDELKEQSAETLQLLFSIAGAFEPELEPETLGLSAAEGKVLSGILDFAKDKTINEPLEEKLLDLFYPEGDDGDLTSSSQRQAQAQGELLVASMLYAKNPKWLPGAPADPATARGEIGDLVKIALTTDPATLTENVNAFVAAHPGTSDQQVSLVLTDLEAVGGQYAIGSQPSGH